MPYCPQCGHLLEEDHKFCPNCGAAVKASGPKIYGRIVFKRLPCAVAKLVKTIISVDGQVIAELGEREEYTYSLPTGLHEIEIRVNFSNQVLRKQVRVVSVDKAIVFPFKIGASGKAAYCAVNQLNRKSTQKGGKKIVFRVLCLLLAAILLFLSWKFFSFLKDNPMPSTPAQTTAPAETLGFKSVAGSAGDWEVTVNDFYYCESINVGLLHEYRAEDGSKYCVVNVTVKNIGTEASIFLPYLSYNSDSHTRLVWRGYEYIRSELFAAEDNLSNESLNPLVFKNGNIVFEVPAEMETSEEAPVFFVTMGEESFTCELAKE